ncbi:FHA domain-containing protein [bacterium]|nr:FHA domain-containing protein [bacterium]
MAYQICLTHPRLGETTKEFDGQRTLLGRSGSGAAIEVADPRVSSRHGEIWADSQGVWYEDLGSSNGSWLNGQRLNRPVRLAPDVELTLGETRLSVFRQLPDGLKLSLLGRSGSHGLTLALGDQSKYLEAIYALTEGLFAQDFLPELLSRIRQAVPMANEPAVISWPPQADGTLHYLGGRPGSASSSLAHYAAEGGKAMLFNGEMPKAIANAPSIRLRGVKGAIYVPLEENEQIFAMLCAGSVLPFSELDFQFFCAAAGLLAARLSSERLRQQAAQREALANFLRIASHDLKNPLQAIENCVRILERLPKEKQAPVLEMLLGASGRAKELITNYLDIATVEGGKPLEVKWETIDLAALIEEEIRFLRAAQREQMEKVTIVNDVSGQISGDARKIRQVLSNLLSNAVKYSPDGGEVRLRREHNQISISDQGVGISLENQQKLFAAFERVGDRSIASGTGLGLWLTAALIHAHGGELGVHSELGRGSTFWFRLPA